MGSGFKVGTVFGINIHVDWSWIFIFLLVTWNLAGAVFPSLHPNWSRGIDIALGIVASLLFFLSIPLHEPAHSLVAKARGLRVRQVMIPENDLDVVTPGQDAMDAFQKLANKEMRQIPVVQGGKLIGMQRRRDILRWLQVRSEMMNS